MIYKIKIKDKKTEQEDFVIMGNSYKSFEEHFKDIISHWTGKWHYENKDKHAKCFGRTINKEILEISYSKDKFVSFGGLKMAAESVYDEKVEDHNKSENSSPCKSLRHIHWKLKDNDFILGLLKRSRVISEEALKELRK